MTVENISWPNLHERMLPTRWESNPQPPDHQLDVHPTEPPRLAQNSVKYIALDKIFFFQSKTLKDFQISPRKLMLYRVHTNQKPLGFSMDIYVVGSY